MTEQEKKEQLEKLEKEWQEWRRKCKKYSYLLKAAQEEKKRIEKEIKNL